MNLRCVSIFVAGMCPTLAQAQLLEPQRVRDVGITAIERAIQCEIGIFARLVRGQTLTAERQKAGYAVSEKIASNGGFGVDIGFAILNFGAHATQGNIDDSEIAFDPYNINTKNVQACSQNNTTLQLVGLRSCLAAGAPVYGRSKIKCNTQINVKRDVSGGVKIPWIVTFGPSGSYGTDYTRAIKVSAPASTN